MQGRNQRPASLSKTIHTERHRRLCESLIAARKQAGLTQVVVAQRLGKAQSYVAKYEGGSQRLDVLEYLDIAAALRFDPCEPLRRLSADLGNASDGDADS
jgi:transcriptional regulator with XRE-family HTH domain